MEFNWCIRELRMRIWTNVCAIIDKGYGILALSTPLHNVDMTV